MKELQDILQAFNTAQKANIACALATVVHVEGSSYRRPGARMLVTDTGQLTGAISGGCLEGDALRKALLAISEGTNKLVTYDTTDDDDAKLGIQLGCNGIVYLLFEPIDTSSPHHPISLIRDIVVHRQPAVLSTLFSLKTKNLQPGTCMLYYDGSPITVNKTAQHHVNYQDLMSQDMQATWGKAHSQMMVYEDAQLSALHQYVPAPLSIVIAGAGNDVMPLLHIAGMLGWEVTLVDGRQSHANRQRFPDVKKIVVTKPENCLSQLEVDGKTICVLMSHNYNYDLGMLRVLLKTEARYIGILGPKSKLDRMYDDLEKEGIVVADKERIFSPVGLDIGAETAEEIALSIAAEIKAVVMHKDASMLRFKQRPVHT